MQLSAFLFFLDALHQVFDAYLAKKGLTKGSIRFLFDGNQIKEHQSPEEVSSRSRLHLSPVRNQRPGWVATPHMRVYRAGAYRGRTERLRGLAGASGSNRHTVPPRALNTSPCCNQPPPANPHLRSWTWKTETASMRWWSRRVGMALDGPAQPPHCARLTPCRHPRFQCLRLVASEAWLWKCGGCTGRRQGAAIVLRL